MNEAGPALDARIAVTMGYQRHGSSDTPPWSTDLGHALPLAVRFRLCLIPLEDGRWLAGTPALLGGLTRSGPEIDLDELTGRIVARLDCVAIGATPAHAYALAALKAIESERLPGQAEPLEPT
jgi:hypothetical protein